MIFKYYTADLVVLSDLELEIPSITIKTWFWNTPIDAVYMMKNQLLEWGQADHRIFNLRRIT